MSELFPTPAAGFDSPLEILDGCHQRVRRTCELIERIAVHVEGKGIDDEVRTASASAMRYFDVAGRNHHLDEEEDLFPAMLSAASEQGRAGVEALVARLRADHVALDAHWLALRASLCALAEGREAPLDSATARTFTRAYADHIAEEESLLLPLARRLLSATALERLGASMSARRGVGKTRP